LGLAWGGAWLFTRWGLPVGGLLGPMAVGVALALGQREVRPLPDRLVVVGRSLLALVAASRFSWEIMGLVAHTLIPLLGCIAVASGLSLCNGYLLWRWAGVDRTTAFLSTIPGVSFGMVALSEEMGANTLTVTVLQYLRVLIVAFTVPALAHFFLQPGDGSAIAPLLDTAPVPAPPLDGWTGFLLPLCMASGIWLGTRLNLPSKGFLGTLMVAWVAFSLWPRPVQIPTPLFLGGLWVVGLSIGLRFQWSAIQTLWKAVVIDIGLILGLILACMAIAYTFHQITHVSTMTAILGFTPGGIEAMVATVLELGGNTGLVIAMQMTRMFTLLLVGPGLVMWLAGGSAPAPPSAPSAPPPPQQPS